MHLEEGITTREIMEQLGIVSERQVTLWCEKFRSMEVRDYSLKSKAALKSMHSLMNNIKNGASRYNLK